MTCLAGSEAARLWVKWSSAQRIEPRRAADVNREGGMNGQRALVPVRLGSLFTGPAANPIKQQKCANKEWEHAIESIAHRV